MRRVVRRKVGWYLSIVVHLFFSIMDDHLQSLIKLLLSVSGVVILHGSEYLILNDFLSLEKPVQDKRSDENHQEPEHRQRGWIPQI